MSSSPAVLVATLLVLLVNWLANALPLNGRNAGEVSALFDNPFTPAGYVFGIWGVIYLGTLGFAAYSWRAARRGDRRLEPLAAPYLLACVANVGWILLWHYLRIGASLLAMAVLLLSIGIAWWRARGIVASSPLERVFVQGTLALYFGWICVASFANVAAWCAARGRWPPGLDPATFAIACLGLASVCFAALTLRSRQWIPAAVFAWAAIGIALRSGQPAGVAYAAMAAAVLMLVLIGWVALRKGSTLRVA